MAYSNVSRNYKVLHIQLENRGNEVAQYRPKQVPRVSTACLHSWAKQSEIYALLGEGAPVRSGSRLVTSLVVLVLSFGVFDFAQTATTSLRGTVTDAKGALVQGAVVTLNNQATDYSRTTKSGNDGVYQFLEVPPATYTLTVATPGFATLKQDKVTLQVSQPATLDVVMQVKGTTEVVEVSGEAPLVNTTDASQGN